jgi:adenylylsulfate kinase-like enzyme
VARYRSPHGCSTPGSLYGTIGNTVIAEGRGRVVMFTGPTGSGKSTVGLLWAERNDHQAGFVDQDHVRYFVRSGYVSRRDVDADPSLATARLDQWALAARACGAIAREYVLSGCDCSVAAYRPPTESFGGWEVFDELDPLIVVLCCPIEIALARDAARQGTAHAGEASVHRAFGFDWAAWEDHPLALMVDNSGDDPSDAIECVQEALRSRSSSPV